RSGFGAVTNLKNLYIHDAGQHGLRLYNTDGGTTVTNCVFKDTKRQAISLLNSTAVLNDIEIMDSIAGIIVQGEPSTLEMENITIRLQSETDLWITRKR
ncbi:MAG: right-handed parallel beta-helix repeat-containing protein, partial [Clostridia bacterium]|nr:right-handed parallel beta-helix repeat-containing protein [Clostridia bacterium]